ncbi:MAG: hypothetical protein LIO63_08570 [Akkermansia sp.]|nr:hypothetical protein [Akkermansia sp.]
MEQFQVAAVQPNGSNGLHLKNGASPVNQEFRRSWVGLNVDMAGGTRFHTWVRVGGLPMRETYSNGRTKKNYTYTDIFDIWLQQDIAAVKGLNVRVGKLKPLFSTDYITPSSAIVCVERSLVSAQYGLDSNWGVDVTWQPDKKNKLYFQLLANDRAATSKSTAHSDVYRDGRGVKGEFGWEDKCYAILGASHRYAVHEEGWQEVSAQYAHDFNNAYSNRRAPGANCYGIGVRDAFSLGYDAKYRRLTFTANLIANFEMSGGHGSNNIGIQLQPVFSLSPHADFVLRYTGMTGDGACKLSADRYICTQTTADSWVDSVHAFYAGVDLYASAKNKNALKFMLGAEYLTARKGGADCYNGWEFSTAMRWSF